MLTNVLDIRPADHRNLEALAALEASSFSDAWSRRSLADELDKPHTQLWLATVDDEIQGYACFLNIVDESELLRLAVFPGRRRSGVGQAVLRHGLESLVGRGIRRCHLEVRADNAAARRLYEKLGFEVSGRRKGYYRASAGDLPSTAVDAILYQRLIAPGD